MTPAPYWEISRHADRKPFLDARAAILRAVRGWFERQGFTEVEPNLVVASPGAETHIDAVTADGGYLHTSPEFAMKRLLAAGERKIFYLGKCWRKGETGPLHAPEFTMIEWYRADAPYEEVQGDCIDLVRLACEITGVDALRWRDGACDPFAEPQTLSVATAFSDIAGISGVIDGDRERLIATSGVTARADDTWSDIFSRALVEKVEPFLGAATPTLLTEYPIREAALARRCPHDARVAERFELYACGVELANGFGELTDPVEQRARLIEAMDEKQKRYGQRWPIDEDFLAALAHMPPASGVALGFDRLVMLATGARHINDVLWTPQQ